MEAVDSGLVREAESIDFEQLSARCMGNGALVRRIVEKFDVQFAEDAAELKQLIVSGDLARAAAVAHRMKGSAASVAAEGLSSLCAGIEAGARVGDASKVSRLAVELQQVWLRAHEQIQHFFKA